MTRPQVATLERLLSQKKRLTAPPEASSRLKVLRQWQSARLARTYRDLREDPLCAAAVEFFLTELYGAQDFSERDSELLRAWRYLKRTLPGPALAVLASAIELDLLSAELDRAMAAIIPAGALSEKQYAKAYRAVGSRDARERQIDLIVQIGKSLERIVRHAWIGALLRAAHAPAHAAGFGVLQGFLERGYGAFRQMESADRVLATVRTRETVLMDALFAGAEDAFRLVEPGRMP
jgi:hypothetical protein